MISIDKVNYQDFLSRSVHYLENRGFKNIRADLKGYDTPKSFIKKGSDVTITPDIVADKKGIKHFFEISVKSEKPHLLKSKWMFLDVLSKMKSYRFKIITTKGHYKFTNTMLDDLNLDKKMIKLN
ncbi:hypothetical protein OOZ15_03745 [Galbibacter sp. EGI 63066]|uniref:hypothetical protein n=1 Tax=Galbibacter sp. EGI 63066 TaxID=2993559 RepID=UPI0022494AC6|nr:hypothetical protein [Galbibacter sp. EGI 63066]MCX2679044.1 hypothetical protein [Galbibacter sp. EGI 63066]